MRHAPVMRKWMLRLAIGTAMLAGLVVNTSVLWWWWSTPEQSQARWVQAYADRLTGVWELQVDGRAPRLLVLAPAPRAWSNPDVTIAGRPGLVASAQACGNTSLIAEASACADTWSTPYLALELRGSLVLPRQAVLRGFSMRQAVLHLELFGFEDSFRVDGEPSLTELDTTDGDRAARLVPLSIRATQRPAPRR